MTAERPPRTRPPRGTTGGDALAERRRTRTLELAMSGRTYRAIVEALQPSDTPTSLATINKDLKLMATRFQEEAFQSRTDMMFQDAARLARLMNAHWQNAMGGDIQSSRIVLEVVRANSEMFDYPGLNLPEKPTTDQPVELTPYEEAVMLMTLQSLRAGRPAPSFGQPPQLPPAGPVRAGYEHVPPPPNRVTVDSEFLEVRDDDVRTAADLGGVEQAEPRRPRSQRRKARARRLQATDEGGAVGPVRTDGLPDGDAAGGPGYGRPV